MKLFTFLALFLALCSCSTSITENKNENPKLKFEKFFDGNLIAHGFFKDRFNKVTKTFVVKMKASWKDQTGTLDESFTYNDGTTSTRVWTFTKISENEYSGTAPDVIGKAHGIISGNTLRWDYVLKLKVDKKEYVVNFEDWMYLVDESTLLNQSYMTKFNVNLGQVVLSIKKE